MFTLIWPRTELPKKYVGHKVVIGKKKLIGRDWIFPERMTVTDAERYWKHWITLLRGQDVWTPETAIFGSSVYAAVQAQKSNTKKKISKLSKQKFSKHYRYAFIDQFSFNCSTQEGFELRPKECERKKLELVSFICFAVKNILKIQRKVLFS